MRMKKSKKMVPAILATVILISVFTVTATAATYYVAQGDGYDMGAYEYIDANSPSIIIDHTCTDLSPVPEEWITTAKDTFRVWYGHTSHGSQITSGMAAMNISPYIFNIGTEIIQGSLSYQEGTGVDLGHEGDLTWRDITVAQLNQPGNDRNVVMWSWCGGVSDNTEDGINTYLNAMNQLEIDYPNVTFIYMTGHLDGTGESGNLNIRNNQIRDYCRANEKILFDFADIESYDPDGNYYLDHQANDNCDYFDGSQWRNWAIEWCDAHPGECSSCECAHSQSLNCDLKARAFWWMMARFAGWESAPPTVSIATDKFEYTIGDTMTTTIGFKNPTPDTVDTYFIWYSGLPDYGYWQRILVTSFTLPAGFDESYDIPIGIGDWGAVGFNATWYVALLNTTPPYETISQDTADWRYVPTAASTAEQEITLTPEEIATEIMKTVEREELPIQYL